jgi:hypothetical protein
MRRHYYLVKNIFQLSNVSYAATIYVRYKRRRDIPFGSTDFSLLHMHTHTHTHTHTLSHIHTYTPTFDSTTSAIFNCMQPAVTIVVANNTRVKCVHVGFAHFNVTFYN